MQYVFSAILVVLAILQVIFPAQALMFGKRWQFKEGAQPSDLAILFARAGGIVIIVIVAMYWLARG